MSAGKNSTVLLRTARHCRYEQAADQNEQTACILCLQRRSVTALYRDIQPCEGAGAPPHRPDVPLRRRPQADAAISGRQLRFRRSFRDIRYGTARLPRRFAPRNDKLESLHVRRECLAICSCLRRSLSAATDRETSCRR